MPNMNDFIKESNAIEGIFREPSELEIEASWQFVTQEAIGLPDVNFIQAVYAPGCPLRNKRGMDVRVGDHIPPLGGKQVETELDELISSADSIHPWTLHVRFEYLHPYMDGNGRTGRILWAWSMFQRAADPFSLPFLHRFYYQTLEGKKR